MIEYRYNEERIVALLFAEELHDELAKEILLRGRVLSKEEAKHLSQFFWHMVNKSAEGRIRLPCEGSSQYWTEKLYNSIGGYLENAGYGKEWDGEVDKA
jgi:hypothetical protein